MLLTAYNLPNYILQKGTDRKFCALSNIFSGKDTFLIETVDEHNPRNTLLKCTVGEQSFVFKQPKFLVNGGTWLIVNEYQFYKSFPDLRVKPEQFSFDEDYKVLLLPYLYSLAGLEEVIDSSEKLQTYAQQAATSLALLHQSLRISNNMVVKQFIKNHCFNQIPTYQSFLNLLQRGYNQPQFLDEVVFPAFALIAPTRAILHHVLGKDILAKSLHELASQSTEDYLIHGDLKIENLMQEKGQSLLKFIDYESVSKGDHAWDFACFLESVLYQPALRRGATPEKHNNSLIKRFFFFAVYANTYSTKIDLSETEHRNFLSRVLKFWAIRKLERLRIYDGNFNYLLKSLEVIKRLLLETDFYIDQIYNSGEKKFEIFEF